MRSTPFTFVQGRFFTILIFDRFLSGDDPHKLNVERVNMQVNSIIDLYIRPARNNRQMEIVD